MGFSADEHLVVVTSDCILYVFDIDGKKLFQTYFPDEVSHQGLLEIKIWDTGALLFTKEFDIWVANSFKDVFKLPKTDIIEIPYWIEVCPLGMNNFEVLMAPRDGSILSITPKEWVDFELLNGPFSRISASPNGEFIAVFTKDGFLWIIKSDFCENWTEFGTDISSSPDQFIWCGNEAVCLFWRADQIETEYNQSMLLIVGLNGQYHKLYFDNYICLSSEIDGLRIFHNNTCEFLQKVSENLEHIFGIGSLDPSALLYDSYLEYENKQNSTVKSTRSLQKDKIPVAILKCIEAALYEVDTNIQKKLLKAASYGKLLTNEFSEHQKFNHACQTIRIINSVKDKEIGIPLTYEQYKILTPEVLGNRLAHRNFHLLAFSIYEYLNFDIQNIGLHWIFTILQKEEDDSKITEYIRTQFQNTMEKISYGQLSSFAFQMGKKSLAIKLLQYEENFNEQIPLLLQLEEKARALTRAIESGESDFIYFVLIGLMKKKPKIIFDLFKEKQFEIAKNLFLKYLKEKDIQLYRQSLDTLQMSFESGCIPLFQSIFPENLRKIPKEELLNDALKSFEKNKKKLTFEISIVKDHIDLVGYQKELDESLTQASKDKKPVNEFKNLTINETIEKLLVYGNEELAQKFKKDFKMSDKMFCWCKVKAYAKTEKWTEFEKLISTKGFPIDIIVRMFI